MKLNWKYIKYKNKIIFAACYGEKLYREFKNMSLACVFEQQNDFSNTIDDFLAEQKKIVEARMNGKYYDRKIERIPNTEFRKQQRKLENINDNKQK